MSQQTEQPGYQRLQVTDQKQMTWENDRLGRKVYADRLTTLIQNTEGPYVIGLTSPWGSGKTFFLQAWHNQLVAEGKPCIYFNAWQMDASGDPLANLIAVCEQQAGDFKGTAARIKEKFKKAFEKLPGLLRGAGWLAALCGIPAGSAMETSATVIEKIQDILKKNKDFTEQLQILAAEIARETNFPLFIIVDELDRCRPSYAIDLLESIKHLFNVPHVVFLLAVDSTQLLQQVEHTFGLKACVEDGKVVRDPRQEYLEKFFDIYYNLPVADNAEFVKNILHNINLVNVYSDIFKKTIHMQFELNEILAADKRLFSAKPLRRLLQDIEKFSLYIRCYNDLNIDEILTAFLIIFLYGDTYRDSIGKELSDSTMEELNTLKRDIESEKRTLLRKKIRDKTYTPEICSYMFIKFSMLNIQQSKSREDIIAYYSAAAGHYLKQTFPRAGSTPGIYLKNFTEITPSVINRLRYLEDFTPTLPTEETSSTAAPVSNPDA